MEHPENCPVCHRPIRGSWEWSSYLGTCYSCEKEEYDDDTYADPSDGNEEYE